MGFFSKLKQNFTHGGVKIDMQAPASASSQDAQLMVTVLLTAADSQAQINSTRVEIYSESHDQNFNSNNSGASAPTTTQLVARAENTEQFTLMPGQSKSIQLNIVMNAGAAVEAQLPQGSGMAQVANAMQQLQAIGEALHANTATYYIQASADVDGVMLDPSVRRPIQILKPGQAGGAINTGL